MIIVSIPPMQYLMKRIAGDDIEVRSLIDSSDNAELFEPRPGQLRLFNRADSYFSLQLPFERKWLKLVKENNPQLIIEECCDDLRRVFSEHDHEFHEADKDPHIWTDPVINRDIAFRMRNLLITLFPDHEKRFINNYAELERELVSLHKEIILLTEGLEDKIFIVSHPAWSYFSDRYGFLQIPLEYEGKEIGIRSTVTLVELAREKNIDTVFIQRQIKSSSAIALANEIGAKLVELDPLAEDHLKNLLFTATQITSSLKY